MEQKKPFEEGSAPFNMALDTLRRLGTILENIKEINADISIPQAKAQEVKLNFIKSFYINATPLLNEKVIEKFKSVLELRPVEAIVLDSVTKRNKGKRKIFDYDLEVKLDKVLVDLQQALQKEKYFMPPKNDPRFSWKQD